MTHLVGPNNVDVEPYSISIGLLTGVYGGLCITVGLFFSHMSMVYTNMFNIVFSCLRQDDWMVLKHKFSFVTRSSNGESGKFCWPAIIGECQGNQNKRTQNPWPRF